MCRICDGEDPRRLLEETKLHIIHHGWFLQGILGDHGRPGSTWVYTVGLLENFGHPELVMTDVSYEEASVLLNQVGEWIRNRENIRELDAKLPASVIRQVHPDHFDNDLVNTFIEVYERRPEAGEFLQVFPPLYCRDHMHQLTDLSDPDQFPGSRRRAA